MIKVMFWNIDKKIGFENTICDILKKEDIDILLLAEAGNIDDSEIEKNSSLKRKASPYATDQIKLTPRFYSNDLGFSLEHYHTNPNTKRMVFAYLDFPKKDPILFCGVHFRSKLMRNTETQVAEAALYNQYINTIEDKFKRTIVLGDFNINPFELGMISPIGFNATLTKVVAKSGQRDFMNNMFDYYYNPMWNFIGDINYQSGQLKLPGGYYFKSNDSVTQTYWNLLDNLIIRPSLIDEIDLASITLLEESKPHVLVNKIADEYQIDSVNYSDHLPLIFKIKK